MDKRKEGRTEIFSGQRQIVSTYTADESRFSTLKIKTTKNEIHPIETMKCPMCVG